MSDGADRPPPSLTPMMCKNNGFASHFEQRHEMVKCSMSCLSLTALYSIIGGQMNVVSVLLYTMLPKVA